MKVCSHKNRLTLFRKATEINEQKIKATSTNRQKGLDFSERLPEGVTNLLIHFQSLSRNSRLSSGPQLSKNLPFCTRTQTTNLPDYYKGNQINALR